MPGIAVDLAADELQQDALKGAVGLQRTIIHGEDTIGVESDIVHHALCRAGLGSRHLNHQRAATSTCAASRDMPLAVEPEREN